MHQRIPRRDLPYLAGAPLLGAQTGRAATRRSRMPETLPGGVSRIIGDTLTRELGSLIID